MNTVYIQLGSNIGERKSYITKSIDQIEKNIGEMKLILGDNQFFGINHHDLQKGNKTKLKFSDEHKITEFIEETIKLGLDGFMINSNDTGYKIVNNYKAKEKEEIHYSIPYPHKYATMVNEEGMLSLLKYFISKTSLTTHNN